MSAQRQPGGRFGPGNCANPNGRPRRKNSVSASILKELTAPVTITENQKRKSVSKLAANAKQLANKGASGDLRAAKMVIDFAQRAEGMVEAATPQRVLTPADRAVAERFISRLQAQWQTDASDEEPA